MSGYFRIFFKINTNSENITQSVMGYFFFDGVAKKER